MPGPTWESSLLSGFRESVLEQGLGETERPLRGTRPIILQFQKRKCWGEVNGQGYEVATGPSSELTGYVCKNQMTDISLSGEMHP